MIRYSKDLNSFFFTLSINLGFTDLFNIEQKLSMQTLASQFYREFALQHEEVDVFAKDLK